MDFIYYIILVLFMMEYVPVECIYKYLSPHGRKKQRGPCVGSTWVEFGRFRFWQREKCVNRRSEFGGGKKETYNALKMEMDDIPSLEEGPPRNSSYNPTYGYEPYWADGNWVFDKKPPNQTNLDPNDMCGVKCSMVYIEYGWICARDINYNYRSFKNYCTMKSHDCPGNDKWTVLYKGECYRPLKDDYQRHNLSYRADKFINEAITQFTGTTYSYIGTPFPLTMKAKEVPKLP